MSDSLPYSYNTENTFNALFVPQPSQVHLINNRTATYFSRRLLQKAMSVFKWSGLPDFWDEGYFLYTLYIMGFVSIIDTAKFGIIPQACTLTGYNVFYAPKKIIISNPLLPNFTEKTIDKDCVVLKLQPDYSSICEIISYYAGKMALIAEDIDINLQNSKLTEVFFAKNKATAESFKKVYDEIMQGRPAVVIDKDLQNLDGSNNWEPFIANLKNNFIVPDLLDALDTIENQFLTEIGIKNANIDKRERLNIEEVNSNNEETKSTGELWLESLKKGVEKANEMFSLNISVEWRFTENERDNVDSRPDKLQAEPV